MKLHNRLLVGILLVLGGLSTLPVLAQDAAPVEMVNCLATPYGDGCYAGLPAGQYQLLQDEMLLHPEPNVTPLPANTDELKRFKFRKLVNPAGTNVYDAPNGNLVSTIAPGFNFVTVYNRAEGWVEINPGQWVVDADTEVASPSEYAGVFINDQHLDYPMAWVLVTGYPSPFPGAVPDESRELVRRYRRVNLFKTATVDGWEWYLIAPDTWIKQTQVARVNFIERAEGIKGRWVAVDLYEQVLVAYDEQNMPIFATLISSGLQQWSTNEGTFRTWARIQLDGMRGAEGQADFYSLEAVPWTLYFDNAISLHGAYWHDGFGYRRSHGCVNMSLSDSFWLYHWTYEGGYEKPWVHVFSSGEYIQ